MPNSRHDQGFKVVNALDEESWRGYVDQHPQGNVFHTPEMFQVFAQAKGYRPSLWAAVDNRGRVLALLLPVFVSLASGVLQRLTSRAIAYGSVLYTPGPKGVEALDALFKTYTGTVGHQALYTELRHLSSTDSIRSVLTENGFRYEEHLNYLIDLDRPTAEIMAGISKSGRKAIRRSKRRGTVFEEIQDRSLIPVHYGLLRQTYTRTRVPLADISLFEAVFDVLVPKGMAKMLLARVDNHYVAASLEVPYKDIIYSWYSGYDPAFRSAYPNDGLVWYILEWGAVNGYRCFDFGGAGRPDEPYSVRTFKAKFGGQLVNFGRHVCVHAPRALALSRMGYQICRRLVRHL